MSTAVQQAPAQYSPTSSQLAMAYSVCSGIARTSARNFYYAFLVLPHAKRNALCAIYAYMRRCDDLSDDASLPLRERRAKLEAWLEAFHRAQAGESTDDAILLALTDTQRRYQIPAELLDQLAFGTLMDVPEDVESSEGQAAQETSEELVIQYRTFKDLYLYCYHVASVVGLVCIKIFGYRDPNAEHLAERCGIAFQLTNIIRDVKEDVLMGRVYLPLEDLQRFELSPTDLKSGPDRARLRSLLTMEADRARDFYKSGHDLIPLVNEDSQPALWVLVTIYQRLLEKIAQKQYDVFAGKIRLTTFEKLSVLGKGFLKRLT
ncbi:MAG TPA: phytoene/squalene synthase family protein [Terriglobales bacterium]|nr:phytoene/squalene synthase family protein [Terriglobales bacterium]